MFKLLFISLTAFSGSSVFTSFIDSKSSIDLFKTPISAALMTSYDCPLCDALLKKLNKKCKSLDLHIFAAGTKKQLKNKLKSFLDKKTPIFYGEDTSLFSKLGDDLTPFYISKKEKKYEGGKQVFKGILRDKVCKK